MENGIPTHTIYINNLNEKVKLAELKTALYAMFSQFGEILEVLAKKTLKCRGQAWISFKEPSAAAQALNSMQGFSFHDKPMKIAFAKKKSDAVAKMEGTFVPRPRLPKGEKRRREQLGSDDDEDSPAPAPAAGAAPAGMPPAVPGGPPVPPAGFPPGAPPFGMPPGMPPFGVPPGMPPPPFGMPPFGFPPGFPPGAPPGTDSSAAGFGAPPGAPPAAPAPAPRPAGPSENPPNNILLLTGLPEETTDKMLIALFGQHPGLVEVRQIPGRHDIAFIEYGNDYQATVAKTTLQGFKITPTHALNVNFAKKS
eukprot:comp22802_c0_seq1/m.35768 comp22802_c0_seq1/g.35768  ORF comp22802_c0_seq1/g.35768 comp22802_c0_seq1/m.35768 type:complete len:309 (-) comp22802_c0_seq1:170-1096(-)